MSTPSNPTNADRIVALLRERPRHWRDLAAELGTNDATISAQLTVLHRRGKVDGDPNRTGVWHIAAEGVPE